MKQASESHFLVVGVVRNCHQSLLRDVALLREALGFALSVRWLLIESDSSDATVDSLQQLASEDENFRFRALGRLAETMPSRTGRIAFCRNAYLEDIDNDPVYRDVDYVMVADFDSINRLITQAGILSCWNRAGWDACMANQRGPYYDIWALRHPAWSSNDCQEQFRFLSKYNRNRSEVLQAAIYSKMIKLPEESEWIEVDSAFGGLAIYGRHVFCGERYSGVAADGSEVCEHVSLHRQMKERGRRFYINPAMINAAYTEHTVRLMSGVRQLTFVKRWIEGRVKGLLGR